VYAVTREENFARDRGLSDQIRRAAVSVMSNIAEGFERGAVTEFIQFLFIAKGSCGEVRAQLQIACDQRYITAEVHASLTALARRSGGMISNFIAHLQQSGYRGEKFSRPQRQAASAHQDRLAAVREAQLRNIRPTPPSPPSDPPKP
jgi:four helix bundle protein